MPVAELAELAVDVFGEEKVHVAGRMDEAIALAVDLVEADALRRGRHRGDHHRLGGVRRRRPLADRSGAGMTGPAAPARSRTRPDPSTGRGTVERRAAAARHCLAGRTTRRSGLRGIMSATLVLEAITVLLAIPVAANTGGGVGPLGLVSDLRCWPCCWSRPAAIVSRPYALQVILGLQVVMIACWLITPPLGVMGIIFGVVWAVILWFRANFGAGSRPVRCLGRRNRAVRSRPLAGGVRSTDRRPSQRAAAAARARELLPHVFRYRCGTNPGPDQARRRRAGTGR